MSKKQKPVLSLVEESDEQWLAKIRANLERMSDEGLRIFAEEIKRLTETPEAEPSPIIREIRGTIKAREALERKNRLKTARFGKIRLANTHPRA